MLYEALLVRAGDGRVRVGVIGCGTFGRGLVAQALRMSGVELVAVADADASAARAAVGDAVAVFEDGMDVVAAEVDVVVEATGVPSAGAAHALAAIDAGRHVAMVSKETDAVVGPMLKTLADERGVVYTAVDGDQHGLIMGLVDWCRALGCEVLCAGKVLDGEWGYLDGDELPGGVRVWDHACKIALPEHESELMEFARYGDGQRVLARRDRLLAGGLRGIGGWDLTELVIAANGTGLGFAAHGVGRSPGAAGVGVTCPVLRVAEIAQVMCPAESGGVLSAAAVIDAVRVVRRRDEAGMGGGVFAVVRGDNRVIQWATRNESIQPGEAGSTLVVLRPHHFLGMEAMLSVVLAGRCGVATGARSYEQRWDRVVRVGRDFAAGEVLGDDHSVDLEHEVAPAAGIDELGAALPAHLGQGCRLARPLQRGSVVRVGDVVEPTRGAEAGLWALRRRQDRL